MTVDTTVHLEELGEEACYRLLRQTPFGRVALTAAALPVVLPVHYALLGRDPVFRTDPGSKLSAAGSGQVLCLEIDALDPLAHHGWSVNVIGRADVLADPDELRAAARLPLRPWVGHGDAYVRITAAIVTGRRIAGPQDRPGHRPAWQRESGA